MVPINMRNPFSKERTITIDEISVLIEKHMSTLREEINQILIDQQDYYKKTECERIEREDIMESTRVERENNVSEQGLIFEGYINNSMREVSDHLVELLNKTDDPIPKTNYSKPRFFFH